MMHDKEASTSKCRKCGKPIYWHKSREGKSYPCNSDNRRDFHRCEESAQPKAAPSPQPMTPSYFEATLEQRVAHLEEQVKNLTRTVQAVEARQPISAEDVGF